MFVDFYVLRFMLLTYLIYIIDSRPSVCDTFECDSDKCLPFSSVCDGIGDCLDGTDEGLHCRTATQECVAKHEYLCNDGQCILSSLRCDGSSDCLDGSDEMHCDVDYEQPFCKEFTCDKGERCLSLKYLCDGHPQCADGTDESGLHCTILSNDCSGADEFLCQNGHCLPAMFRCDGSSDCQDDSDEQGCSPDIPKTECSETGGFTCLNGHCLPAMFRCDGHSDCLDKSDEQGCPTDALLYPNGLGTSEQTKISSEPNEKHNPTINSVSPTTEREVTTYKSSRPTTDQIKFIKTSLSARNDTNTISVTQVASSQAPLTKFNVIDHVKPSTDRTNDDYDIGNINSKRASYHMRNLYGGTAVVLTAASVAAIVLVVIRRRRKKPHMTVLKTTVHYINPFYGSA